MPSIGVGRRAWAKTSQLDNKSDQERLAALGELGRGIGEIDSIEALETVMERLGIELSRSLKSATPVFTGALQSSTHNDLITISKKHFTRLGDVSYVRVEIIQDAISRPPYYTYPAIYYKNQVALGRRRGFQPPTTALESWVMAKLGVSPTESRRAAFAVAKTIEDHGTRNKRKRVVPYPDQVVRNNAEKIRNVGILMRQRIIAKAFPTRRNIVVP